MGFNCNRRETSWHRDSLVFLQRFPAALILEKPIYRTTVWTVSTQEIADSCGTAKSTWGYVRLK